MNISGGAALLNYAIQPTCYMNLPYGRILLVMKETPGVVTLTKGAEIVGHPAGYTAQGTAEDNRRDDVAATESNRRFQSTVAAWPGCPPS